jgi:hypothetical protein
LVANYMLLALLIAVSHSSARRLHEVGAPANAISQPPQV